MSADPSFPADLIAFGLKPTPPQPKGLTSDLSTRSATLISADSHEFLKAPLQRALGRELEAQEERRRQGPDAAHFGVRRGLLDRLAERFDFGFHTSNRI